MGPTSRHVDPEGRQPAGFLGEGDVTPNLLSPAQRGRGHWQHSVLMVEEFSLCELAKSGMEFGFYILAILEMPPDERRGGFSLNSGRPFRKSSRA